MFANHVEHLKQADEKSHAKTTSLAFINMRAGVSTYFSSYSTRICSRRQNAIETQRKTGESMKRGAPEAHQTLHSHQLSELHDSLLFIEICSL